MEGSILSLLPPVITIALTIITKRILLSLGVGIIFGALLANGWNAAASVSTILSIIGTVLGEGNIFVFILIVGAMSALIYLSGGIQAFSEWAVTKVRTPFQAKLVTLLLGFVSFFDDAFSCLFRGSVIKPLTDQHNISHSKLAYLLHSTSAPVIILMPISAWAAFIAALMATIFVDNGITQYQGYEAFLLTIPTNYYALSTILLVFAVAYFNINLGQMKRDEKRAKEEGILFDTSRGIVPGQSVAELPTKEGGNLLDLFLPVGILVALTVIIAGWGGITSAEGALTPLNVLMNAEVITALVYSGLVACAVSVIRLLLRKTAGKEVATAMFIGAKSVFPSIIILFMALMTAQVIGLLGVGQYLASLIDGNLSLMWLPVIFFVISAFMSFSMGSTFGTFGLMLPIGAEIVAIVDIAYLIPVFGAVLAGCIFGEHSSPLSDTTILAAIGGGVHPIDHLMTQMPYAMVSSFVSIIGYVTLGLTKNLFVGLAAMLISLALIVFALVKAREKAGASSMALEANKP
ncbi:Na+/H+ antiporter NhaC family protein [Planococcus shenhongbingii]|uniref:Na+/H+ antiporter NhaC family protein n=1 Tax=Planococcus shenhongbingii TaxID=3058398 RepID=UPI002606A96B|nr:Na+/H+ antiporter NhaC family protein [Planococcus sp. N016]WKA58858.1 Na+/H+ antiporter NhaC family protein [Planococcus sp. N016]